MTVTPSNFAGTLLYSPAAYWNQPVITFGFPQKGGTDRVSQFNYDEEPDAPGYSGLNAQQQQAAIAAIAEWDKLIANSFSLVTDTTSIANIRFAFTDFSEILNSWGYAFAPPLNGTFGAPWSGDIWINTSEKTSTFDIGGFDFNALLHEIGHAIGLQHTFTASGYNMAYDANTYSIMSYTDINHVQWTFGLVGNNLRATPNPIYPSTPMVIDIAAIQQRYGADPNTATGNDTYTFSETAPFIRAIYDAGGIDTIDVSNHTRGSMIDLRPGAYSDIARWSLTDQIAYWTNQFPLAPAFIASVFNNPSNDAYTWTNNLGIAFTTVIENVRAGPGNDVIYGNAANNDIRAGGGDNEIHAGDGDDFILAGMGNDLIDGGYGNDSMILNYNFSEGGLIRYVIGYFMGGEGIDFIARVERFTFLDGVIDLNDADPMIDDLFYYGYNRDVWNAKVDADTHYKTTGWKEGRDPNDFFDTKGYMAAYGAEVLASGLDPLTHYLTIGWKKNYDPSKQFDTSQYLAFHTDVASSGQNPLVHFLTNGQYEFRQYFNDGVFDL